MGLNKSQAEAVGHLSGPMLVLAGPGSGKTKVITERTRHLITRHGVDPSHVLVITFTKAAAAEMRQRFCRLMGGRKYPVTFGTFHAVFFQILKHAYGFHAGNIARDEQRSWFMREILQSLRLECDDEKEMVADLLGEVGIVKNTGVPLEQYDPKCCAKEDFLRVFQAYDASMKQRRLIDFDDMLVYCHELFLKRKDILAAWQMKFQYILVDEFQDINRIQFEIVRMLAQPEDNLFAVGDDDQSIYGFRGARPELMLEFREVYPQARRVLLDTNYRSPQEIVEASIRLISHNAKRFEKEIHSSGEDGGTAKAPLSPCVRYSLWNDQREEGDAIIRQIMDACKNGRNYRDIAVLFRTNVQPRKFMSQLMSYNIPFRAKDKIPNIYEHWIAKDIFAYLRLAAGSRARKDILQIMNRPNRYITRDSLEKETVDFDAWADYFYGKQQDWVAERIAQLEADLRAIGRVRPFAAINYIRMGIGYEDYLREYADYRKIRADSLIETLDELQDDAREFPDYESWLAHVRDYEEEWKRQKEKEQKEQTDSVSLATLHSAKGLEYPIVHIIDVNEGLMPYKKAVLDDELEEERRMFYVGVTRAKEMLCIHSVSQYNGKDVDVSRFIAEMQGEGDDPASPSREGKPRDAAPGRGEARRESRWRGHQSSSSSSSSSSSRTNSHSSSSRSCSK